MRAIVLSGGGAKGAYEIGVWKALRKLHISYDIVTGTSVGALNGALMIQNTYFKAYRLWNHMDFQLLFQEKDVEDLKSSDHQLLSLAKMYGKNILNGGMDVSKLETLIHKYLNPQRIMKSKKEFAIITVNSKTLKPMVVNKRDIRADKLCDYLMASASCYPVFQKKIVDQIPLIDGGLYDNMPINLAIELGATEIIAVDLNAVGIVRTVKDKSIPITYIKPRNKIGSFLVFDQTQAQRAICFGYNDTMKVFQKLDGKKFTFKKNHIKKTEEKIEHSLKENIKELFSFTENATILDILKANTIYKNFLLEEKRTNGSFLANILDHLGKTFACDEAKIYTIHQFHREIRNKLEKTPKHSLSALKKLKKPPKSEIIKIFYTQLAERSWTNQKKKELCNHALLFPKEYLAAIYLYTIERR